MYLQHKLFILATRRLLGPGVCENSCQNLLFALGLLSSVKFMGEFWQALQYVFGNSVEILFFKNLIFFLFKIIFYIFLNRFNVLMLKIIFFLNIILMYFRAKNTLKNKRYPNAPKLSWACKLLVSHWVSVERVKDRRVSFGVLQKFMLKWLAAAWDLLW